MSCNYAQNLSPYENKGKLGLPEIFDDKDVFESNCKKLVELLKDSNHTVFHTGAGISTSAGIPDFRGPNGVWTLEKKGKTPSVNVDWDDAKPTKTHMALLALQRAGYLSYIVTQNIDGLHLRSGIFRNYIAELHGNLFTDKCGSCQRQYVRANAAPTVGQKCQGISCPGYKKNGRRCRGKLFDTILDWEDSLPDEDFDLAYVHSMAASLSVCLGTSLQIVPSGTLPVHTKKRGGKLVICNLQPTKQDKYADLLIHSYVDDVLLRVLELLDLSLPVYDNLRDPVLMTRKRLSELEFSFNDPRKDGNSSNSSSSPPPSSSSSPLVEYPSEFEPIEWTVPDECVRDIDLMNKMLKKKRNAPEEDEELCFCPKKVHAKTEQAESGDSKPPKQEKEEMTEPKECKSNSPLTPPTGESGSKEERYEGETKKEEEEDDDDDQKEVQPLKDGKEEEEERDQQSSPGFKRESSADSIGMVFDLSYKRADQNHHHFLHKANQFKQHQ